MAIGLIGGTGVYDADILVNVKKEKVHTPYGAPSDLLTCGNFKGKEVVILPRHGANHTYAPHMVNYQANIFALKQMKVDRILSVSAVGSLNKHVKPGDFVFTDQIIDMTHGRKNTFYETGQVAHVSGAEPFCPELRKLLIEAAKKLGVSFHETGTCVVINGPRFSTKAESNLFRSWNADVINMTMAPEVFLAKEAELCYGNIAMVTDYDCWLEHNVSHHDVLKTMEHNIEKVRRLVAEVISNIKDERTCSCKTSMAGAFS